MSSYNLKVILMWCPDNTTSYIISPINTLTLCGLCCWKIWNISHMVWLHKSLNQIIYIVQSKRLPDISIVITLDCDAEQECYACKSWLWYEYYIIPNQFETSNKSGVLHALFGYVALCNAVYGTISIVYSGIGLFTNKICQCNIIVYS